MPAALRPTFPTKAVDHTVTYASWRGWGPKGGDRVILSRHQDLVRKEVRYIGSKRDFETKPEVSYANLGTGASIDIGQAPGGGIASVTLWGAGDSELPNGRTSANQTGATEIIAGERCQIWEGKHESSPVRYTACIASDGVILRDTVHYTDGDVMEEQVAIEVERRAVDLSEVLPPRGVLEWTYWSEFHNSAATTGDRPRNYRLVLASRDERTGRLDGTTAHRAEGGWTAIDECGGRRGRALRIGGAATTLTYFAKPGDRAHLNVSRRRPSSNTVAAAFPSRPLEMEHGNKLGEACTWFDAAVGVSDYSRRECRTRDGLPLIVDESSWGTGKRMEAIALSRGRTPAGSIKPPEWLLDWGYWGWPELAGPSQ